ncbi:MAG TPA: zinc ribbon domain-containing protein [Longilinea sp.]|nr:zinc ribbon domain-containing protein [Longilinea sp.]
MIICKQCHTENDSGSRYCKSCGAPLETSSSASGHSPSNWFGVMTMRLVVTILLLWIAGVVLVNLNFIHQLSIPGLKLSTTSIVGTVILLTIVVLLMKYAFDLSALWPQLFPRMRVGGTLFSGIIQLLALALAYSALQPFMIGLLGGTEPVTILQVALAICAISVVVWVGLDVYRAIPNWIESLRHRQAFSMPSPSFSEPAPALSHAESRPTPSRFNVDAATRPSIPQSEKTVIASKNKPSGGE